MPVFEPRNRIQILREMVARVVARTTGLVGLTRNGAVFHVLSAAANEDAEQYIQMARLRQVFDIEKATGSDLDERAREIQPGTISRRAALRASGDVVFSRPGTTGTITIPLGTLVAASDADGTIRFRTTVAGSIDAGFTTSAPVSVVAIEAGTRSNVADGTINQMITRVSGVAAVTNPAKFTNGVDRESDQSFRARLKAHVQSLSRGIVAALTAAVKTVILTDGRRVNFAKVDEPVIPNGRIIIYIDDGSGSVEEFDDTYIAAFDTIEPAASGGEKELFTTEKPIRDDGSFELYVNAVLQVRNVDYYLNPALGEVELSAASYPTGLTGGDVVTAHYRYYTGLIAEAQRVLDGDGTIQRQGFRAGGIIAAVAPATPVFQSVTGSIAVLDGFDHVAVGEQVESVIQDYINTLDIGEDVILAEIIERAMSVPGMHNIRITNLSGTVPPVDQVILATQVARITSAGITLV